jgi:hypothetical protein
MSLMPLKIKRLKKKLLPSADFSKKVVRVLKVIRKRDYNFDSA